VSDTDRPTDPDALVTAFCAAWARRDVDELMTYFADDATYHNIPMEPAVGAAAIRTFLEGFLAMTSDISFEVHRQVATAGVVMNERTDTMTIGGNTIALPVAGVFEIADGRIAAWRDYFDMAQFSGLGG
jgi:limonene-1,2-epoxide hydrolase